MTSFGCFLPETAGHARSSVTMKMDALQARVSCVGRKVLGEFLSAFLHIEQPLALLKREAIELGTSVVRRERRRIWCKRELEKKLLLPEIPNGINCLKNSC